MLPQKILDVVPAAVRVIRKLSADSLDGSTTIHHLRVLYLIRLGQGPGLIAESLQVSPAAVSKVLSGLESRGLISRCPGKDRRSHDVKLTRQGERILKMVLKDVEQKITKGLQKLRDSEQAQLAAGLGVLEKLVTLIKEDSHET
jgi:DNA-binding MarR family transcriptional regulator